MRALFVLLVLARAAHADGIGVGAAVGAGAQGDATYSGIDVGVDAQWRGARLGLGGRAVWIDGEWRSRDWQEAADAVRVVRLLEIGAGPFALAAGGLSPALIAHVVDGHRAALDDRPRTGVRAAVVGERVDVGAEIDDVLDPSLVGAAAAWEFARPWVMHAAGAIDPGVERSAIELAIGRRWRGDRATAEVGGGFVGEPELGGAQAITFVDGSVERGGARWLASAEVRAGSGSVGAAFGPLHRLERTTMMGTRGVGAALSLGAIANIGWVRAGIRARPELGPLAQVSAGAPLWKWLQAGAWIAAGRRATAGAAEVRVAWARRYATMIEVARMYDTDAAMPTPAWSATAWFGITTN